MGIQAIPEHALEEYRARYQELAEIRRRLLRSRDPKENYRLMFLLEATKERVATLEKRFGGFIPPFEVDQHEAWKRFVKEETGVSV